MQWTGIAILLLDKGHSAREEGYIGAFAGVACEAEHIAEAAAKLADEFQSNGLILAGLEVCCSARCVSVR